MLDKGLIRFKKKIWVGQNAALQTKIVAALHSSGVGSHSGIQATYHRVKGLFHWKGLKQTVEDFVKQCSICNMLNISILIQLGYYNHRQFSKVHGEIYQWILWKGCQRQRGIM
jgi:hypothetical protein